MFLIKIVSLLICMTGLAFVGCEMGERMSTTFNEIEHVIYQLDWYSFPADIRVMLPTVLIYSQKPFNLNGFGSYSYTRNVFTMVSWINRRFVLKKQQHYCTHSTHRYII